jgi:hypothetical protein
MESTFNQVGDIFGSDFNDIGMDEDSDDQNLVNIDSRLDVESVLIEDIKFDLDAIDSRLTDYANYPPEVPNSVSSSDDEVSQGIKCESRVESDENLETLSPQQRDRCNTWPRQLQEASPAPSPPYSSHSPGQALPSVTEDDFKEEEEDDFSPSSSIGSYKSKPNARRNPWGNSSYADLITMAIQSAPDRRLTLSQIYDWMVGAVPYFTERADSSSSAGWKNSIRHNLSLHQKFLKIPNEGAGKSSWWTLNPENNQVKKPRRRATSGDIRTLQCKREKAKKHVENLKMTERLVRSSSINRLQPLSPSFDLSSSHDAYRSRANSTASYHEGAFSSFRSRNLSNASSTGPMSPLHLDDLASHNFPLLTDNIKAESDLDNITLDDLNLESESLSLNPANMLLDFLHPEKREMQSVNPAPAPHKIKILEPREQVSFRDNTKQNEVLNYNGDYFPALSYVTPLQTIDKREHDEVRKPMIIKQLNQLTQKRFEIIQDNANLSVDNKKSMEDDFDLKIMLLQEELNKLTREEEMLKINRYSSASNNPYFSVYNPRAAYSNHHLKRETTPESNVLPTIPMEVTDSPYKRDIKSF